ncbi:MAG: protein-L-isoaspartate O-methyltransferase [Thiohalophilus sp.]|nr:protein-L-isoaspartate O-methyltransferase [Thiohalophilus sp.]MDZ7661040.1 protein-L-isoaspartate O-methyltransferase [Thiohalophilus sp.]
MTEMNFEQARLNMIEQQIRPWEVLDQQVLDLLVEVPREDFVPPEFRKLAFTDMNIPLGHDEVMMSPKLEARMLQALEIKPGDTILEVGTGSGYVTALLGRLGKHVYSVDIHGDFVESAQTKLSAHNIHNVTLDVGDAAHGWDMHAPYDVICLTGSLPILPKAFMHQLKVGGRLFAIVGDPPAMDVIVLTRVGQEDWAREYIFETDLRPLKNAEQPERFVL